MCEAVEAVLLWGGCRCICCFVARFWGLKTQSSLLLEAKSIEKHRKASKNIEKHRKASKNIEKHDKFHDKIWIATRYDIHTWIWIRHFDDYDWTIPKKTNTNKTYLWTKQVPDRSKQFKMIFLVKRDFEGCATSKPVVNRWLWTGLGAFYVHCWNVISKPWLAKPLIHAQMDVFGGVIIDAFFFTWNMPAQITHLENGNSWLVTKLSPNNYIEIIIITTYNYPQLSSIIHNYSLKLFI